jgi:hypothetical protein
LLVQRLRVITLCHGRQRGNTRVGPAGRRTAAVATAAVGTAAARDDEQSWWALLLLLRLLLLKRLAYGRAGLPAAPPGCVLCHARRHIPLTTTLTSHHLLRLLPLPLLLLLQWLLLRQRLDECVAAVAGCCERRGRRV